MIELMVATATASLIVTAMLTFYARQRVMFKSAAETLGAFSNASDALSLVAEAARRAAPSLAPPSRLRDRPYQAVFACDGAQVTGPWDQPTCGPARARLGDGVQFAHSAGSTCRLSDAGSDTDVGIDGMDIEFDASRWFVREFPATRLPELYCLGRGDRASQPMVSGIDTLRIRHGIRSDGVSRSASATTSPEGPMLEGLDLCVTARGRADERAMSYVDCEGQRIALADRTARTVLGGWVAIRSGSAPWR
ncbi:hypothetical protein [Pararobbsia alpina]|uniref:Uncharacterized protein n=1 Tax=Pararobbsia alpina TaxID=621374 RepID=A0A6S7CCT2_9BURK|nr:hypothetical protein [Pararobbsia alpina]CAB3786500.1 hypothetical protein LMG28138_02236 [Pararobbsia alpina]